MKGRMQKVKQTNKLSTIGFSKLLQGITMSSSSIQQQQKKELPKFENFSKIYLLKDTLKNMHILGLSIFLLYVSLNKHLKQSRVYEYILNNYINKQI